MSPPATTAQARRRLRQALSWRTGSGQVIVAVLLAVLGFVTAVQLATPSDVLDRASRADLVQILGGLNTRSDQLEDELARLEDARRDLAAGAGDSEAALEEAQSRLETLGILAGTVPAQGPGVLVRIADPEAAIDAATLLSTVQELRDAGAEAFQIDGSPDRSVRIVASTAFVDLPGGEVSVGGVALGRPWVIVAIGDPDTLSTALGIPGGAIASVRSAGGETAVEESADVLVDALHEASEPTYAQPADPDDLP
jgi:uncharacterized protein YlxW (UPF0749 family)